jgi:SAM-dependent methyltransferase
LTFTSYGAAGMSLKLLARKLKSIGLKKAAINRIIFDSNQCSTELCVIGARHKTDKSPLKELAASEIRHRHAYTPVYDFLFAPLRGKPLAIAEIGIFKAAGLAMLREYFPNATLYGFEHDRDLIEQAQARHLEGTTIDFIDVTSGPQIDAAFERTGKTFDIIIDDSSHNVDDQARIIRHCTRFLHSGGILVIEDIYDDDRAPESKLAEVLDEVGSAYCAVTFVYPRHRNTNVGDWNNEKLLVMVKR